MCSTGKDYLDWASECYLLTASIIRDIGECGLRLREELLYYSFGGIMTSHSLCLVNTTFKAGPHEYEATVLTDTQ